jgi:hypothetical protein
MTALKGLIQEVIHCDKCKKPETEYNLNYNPFIKPIRVLLTEILFMFIQSLWG